jgi:uncharacterized BrkB/YihY/UPF0761 family membrane protein
MKKLEILSNVFSIFGILAMVIFQLTRGSVRWPDFIVNNYEYIAFGSIGVGYILIVIYYFLTKNAKKAKQLLLAAFIITAACFGVYYADKL